MKSNFAENLFVFAGLLARYKLRWKRESDQHDYNEDEFRNLFSKVNYF